MRHPKDAESHVKFKSGSFDSAVPCLLDTLTTVVKKKKKTPPKTSSSAAVLTNSGSKPESRSNCGVFPRRRRRLLLEVRRPFDSRFSPLWFALGLS